MTPLTSIAQDLTLPVAFLYGKRCWGIGAGEGTGSNVTLHFGRQLPRRRELKNPNLPSELRTHEGEIILFIECKWKLEHKGTIVCNSGSSNRQGREMLRGLRRLKDAQVEQVEGTAPPSHLKLKFSKGLVLDVQASNHGDEDNYSLMLPEVILVVDSKLQLRIERRRSILNSLGYEGFSLPK